MEMANFLTASEVKCSRVLGRVLLGIPAKLSLVDGETACTLVDLSLDGAKITTSRKLLRGECLVLKIDGHEAFGSIAWVSAGCAGIMFDERTPKSVLLNLKAVASHYENFIGLKAAEQWASGMA